MKPKQYAYVSSIDLDYLSDLEYYLKTKKVKDYFYHLDVDCECWDVEIYTNKLFDDFPTDCKFIQTNIYEGRALIKQCDCDFLFSLPPKLLEEKHGISRW